MQNYDKTLAAIIQARVGSTRMPNKILEPFFGGQSILDLTLNKLSKIDIRTIVATSTNPMNDSIDILAHKHKVTCFRGDENDVLQRFIDAAESNNIQHIIRICSDNPFLDIHSLYELIEEVQKEKQVYDYISFNIDGNPSIKTHYGFWAEYTSLNALKKVASLTDDKLYHEHVTNYIYANPDIFKVKWISTSPILLTHKVIRLTIDTFDDFRNTQSIYSNVYNKNSTPTIEEIIDFLDENQDYYKTMRNQIIKNSK